MEVMGEWQEVKRQRGKGRSREWERREGLKKENARKGGNPREGRKEKPNQG